MFCSKSFVSLLDRVSTDFCDNKVSNYKSFFRVRFASLLHSRVPNKRAWHNNRAERQKTFGLFIRKSKEMEVLKSDIFPKITHSDQLRFCFAALPKTESALQCKSACKMLWFFEPQKKLSTHFALLLWSDYIHKLLKHRKLARFDVNSPSYLLYSCFKTDPFRKINIFKSS